MSNSKKLFERRKLRNRSQLRHSSGARLRLSVFRSSKHIYAQIIDDVKGVTLVSASTAERDLRSKVKTGANKAAAGEVGKVGVKDVVFDRGGYKYHGRVKALADAAREAGLSF